MKKSIPLSMLLLLSCFVSFLSCVHANIEETQSYPQIWWAHIDPATAPAWEILPQMASQQKNEVILSKRNELGILSNFADTPFIFRGQKYQSIEGLWQGMKYPENDQDPRIQAGVLWPLTRLQVMEQSGFQAKDSGKIANENMKKLGIKWITFEGERIEYNSSDMGKQRHYEIILAAMREKLDQNPLVKSVLLKTGTLKLLPDHDQGLHPAPAYLYANIWMDLRKQLQK
jgi:predicted NAD-dependent protein-ADP-ribosyltransferase YbiA (DUF1768 family)